MRPRTLAATAWTVIILVATLLPEQWMPGSPGTESSGIDVPGVDKIAHLILFGGFGLLWTRAGSPDGRFSAILFGGLLLAILTEGGQGLAFIGRSPDPTDILADTIGLALGIAAYRLIGPRPRPRTADDP